MKLLRSLFNLLNINKLVFDYIDKLPSPNSSKYSFVDYCLKIYFYLKIIQKMIGKQKLEILIMKLMFYLHKFVENKIRILILLKIIIK